MGRAIDMEKDIDKLKMQVDRMDAALAKVIDVMDSMQDKGQRTTHIDLVDDVPSEADEEVIEEKPKSKKSNEKTKRPKKD
jgi:hypothetical protein